MMDSQSKSQTQLKAAVCVNKEQGIRNKEKEKGSGDPKIGW